MKLAYTTADFRLWLNPKQVVGDLNLPIEFINTNTRTLLGQPFGCFFGLKGAFRSGHQFIEEAYEKNIRVFVTSELPTVRHKDAVYFQVDDPLLALQQLAARHRQTVDYPILVIAGKNGKTMVKEWLYELIKSEFHVVRSPKSYNSNLGVALSLFELTNQANFGIIEIAISKPEEFSHLIALVNPTHLLVTNFFKDQTTLNHELFNALSSVPTAFSGEGDEALPAFVNILTERIAYPELMNVSFNDSISLKAATLAIGIAKSIVGDHSMIALQAAKLRRLALRLETFNGKNNSIVINDTYNLDEDAFRFSLDYLAAFAKNRPHCVYVGLGQDQWHKKDVLAALIAPYQLDHVFIDLPERLPTSIPDNAIVLIKGSRKAAMEKFAARLREKQHQTKLEINLSALRHNLIQYKQFLSPQVKLLAMVKAQSYGTGLEKLAEFLELQGVDYLGVAYTNEGVSLRKMGIQLPILVLNPDPNSYLDCVEYALEPTIFTFNQLDEFIRVLIENDADRYPIHVEIDTGMRRLGFEPSEVKSLLEVCQAQPEIFIKGIFSHFVASESPEHSAFTDTQIDRFSQVVTYLKDQLTHTPICHMANSEGIINYKEAHFDMVRLGLGMFGLTSTSLKAALKPVLAWKSLVSQVKWVNAGESISYSRSFIAATTMKIAIVPLGYADGYSRALSNGVGRVRINNHWCHTVGKICMDMMMVDVTTLESVVEGDEVVIFDDIEALEAMSDALNTIPYEVMTGISERIHRVYVSE